MLLVAVLMAIWLPKKEATEAPELANNPLPKSLLQTVDASWGNGQPTFQHPDHEIDRVEEEFDDR